MVFDLGALVVSIVASILMAGINAIILWLLSNYLLNWQDKSIETALKTSLIAGIIVLILNIFASFTSGSFAIILGVLISILNILFLLYFIKKFYNHSNWVEPIKAGVCLFIIDIILGFFVGIILVSLGIAFGMRV